MRLKRFLFFVICIILFNNCSEPLQRVEPIQRKILFLGHTYYWYHKLDIDVRIRILKFEEYDELWLGGDLTIESCKNEAQVKRIDNIFNISSPTTHWAVGNHDTRSGNYELIEKVQQKPLSYSQCDFGITKLILNTTFANKQVPYYLDSCHLLLPQFKLIESVLDTIQKSSHLIVMTGSAHWDEIAPVASHANFNYPSYSFGCDSNLTFKNYLYPKLVEVQKRGVQVICTSGDLGQASKQYEKMTKDSILFLASGINNSFGSYRRKAVDWVRNFDPDKVLVFTHTPETRTLTYKFHKLDSLIGAKSHAITE
jgi:hypothetical protein